MKQQFLYMWEYMVKDDCIDQFAQFYSADGEWVKLFKKSSGFISTELIRDVELSNRFITIDKWRLRKDRDNFRNQFSNEFEALDKRCEAFTIEERFMGDFEIYSPSKY